MDSKTWSAFEALGRALNKNNRSVGFRKVTMPEKEDEPTDINESITKATYDIVQKQEDYLRRLLHAMNVSVAEFSKEYVLEVYPLESESYNERPGDEYRIRFTQSVRVRPKTEEEKKADGA